MSRSIHTTWHERHLERRYDYVNRESQRNRLKEIDRDLEKKHLIKQQIKSRRKSKDSMPDYLAAINSEAIPINISDAGEFIHYPASKDDLIGVLNRLPFDITYGLHSINLCLGAEYQEENEDDLSDVARDPYTGRVCLDDCEPIYLSGIAGTYWPETCKIFLYAFVYNSHDIRLKHVEPFLRLKMLSTFVHELAHHDDSMRRLGRGRWLGLNEDKSEDYAQRIEREWILQAVLPYLYETYPDEYLGLTRWIEDIGGVSFPLEKLAEKAHGIVSPYWIIIDLFRNWLKGKPRNEIMLEFAQDLHYGDHYEKCLIALDSILDENPNHSIALGIKADTLIHLGKYAEAKQVASNCLTIEPSNIDSIDALGDVYQHERDWVTLKEIATRGIELSDDNSFRFMEKRLLALIHLKDYPGAESDCNSLPEKGRILPVKNAFKALILFLQGDIETSLVLSKATLSPKKVNVRARAILKTINNHAIRLGYQAEKLSLTEYEISYLKENGIEELVSSICWNRR